MYINEYLIHKTHLCCFYFYNLGYEGDDDMPDLDDFILPDTFEELMGHQQEQPQQQPVQAATEKSMQNLNTGRREKNRHDRSNDCPNSYTPKTYSKSTPYPTTNPHHESTTRNAEVQ